MLPPPLPPQVGPGEADDGLDAEVGEECNTKYGPVTRWEPQRRERAAPRCACVCRGKPLTFGAV